jgi:hypothetical protein
VDRDEALYDHPARRHATSAWHGMRQSTDRVQGLRPRTYRGHRIVAVHADGTWHAIVHRYTGATMPTNITGSSLADTMGQAEWIIENWVAFRAASQYERVAG